MDKSYKRIMFAAVVRDNQDPWVLGRIRAYPVDGTIRAALEAYDFDETKDKWGPKDPFIQTPLLPMFFAQVPLIDERVNVIYQNSFYPYQDQYYVQGGFSSPMSLPYEQILPANSFTAQGDRVAKTLKLKNPNGVYFSASTEGIFPEPGDNAILGRGTSDMIVKPDTVMLRAGKTKRLDTNKQPVGNPNRAFLQLSNFTSKTVTKNKKTFLSLIASNQQIQKLVEWDIQNLENEQNAFTGAIRLYNLKPVNKTLSDNINFDSDLEDVKSLVFYQPFIGYSFERTVKLINDFIKGVNDGQIPNGPVVENQFPFAYRPSVPNRKILTSTDIKTNPIVFSNITKFVSNVTLNSGLGTESYRFAIVRQKNQIGKPFKVNIEDYQEKSTEMSYGTFGGMGADTLFLISHLSNKNINLEGTLYGIDQTFLEEKILPSTSSMVRGEELIQILNVIVQFLLSHVHTIPGAPAVPVGTDGTSANNILTQLQNAQNTILNPHIRIN